MSGTTDTDSPTGGTLAQLAPLFVKAQQAADILGLSKREIYRLLASGDLTAYPYKRRKMIDYPSVEAFAERVKAGGQ